MRIIAIRHRVKFTAKGEARPTQVTIIENGKSRHFNLKDDDAELNFVLGRHYRAKKIEGLQAGDTVAMVLGGSGDRLAYALSRHGADIGAQVMRIPPSLLQEHRGEKDKNDDDKTLALLFQEKPELFQPTGPRERDVIRVRVCLDGRKDSQKARIACEQRISQRLIGQVFLSEDGKYPEGNIEAEYQRAKANHLALRTLVEQERRATGDLRRAVHNLAVWRHVFSDIEGIGEVLTSGLITAVGDIRRFPNKHKLKAFCGVHILPDGQFPRKRSKQIANWHPTARQALFLMADQFVKRPDSVWGIKYREIKARLREIHPEPITGENGKKKWTDGHIHRTAIWRTLTRFVEWLYPQWIKAENINLKIDKDEISAA